MKHGKRLLIGMLLLTIFLVNMAVPVSAYSYNGDKWNADFVQYDIGSSIPSGWSTPISQAASAWNQAGANFYFYAIGCDNDLSYYGLSGNDAGITYQDYDNGYLSECDTYFNSNYDWSTANQCPSNCLDVRSVATHEFGHWLRLLDLSLFTDKEKTMYKVTYLGETKKRSLDSDDIEGIRDIYP